MILEKNEEINYKIDQLFYENDTLKLSREINTKKKNYIITFIGFLFLSVGIVIYLLPKGTSIEEINSFGLKFFLILLFFIVGNIILLRIFKFDKNTKNIEKEKEKIMKGIFKLIDPSLKEIDIYGIEDIIEDDYFSGTFLSSTNISPNLIDYININDEDFGFNSEEKKKISNYFYDYYFIVGTILNKIVENNFFSGLSLNIGDGLSTFFINEEKQKIFLYNVEINDSNKIQTVFTKKNKELNFPNSIKIQTNIFRKFDTFCFNISIFLFIPYITLSFFIPTLLGGMITRFYNLSGYLELLLYIVIFGIISFLIFGFFTIFQFFYKTIKKIYVKIKKINLEDFDTVFHIESESIENITKIQNNHIFKKYLLSYYTTNNFDFTLIFIDNSYNIFIEKNLIIYHNKSNNTEKLKKYYKEKIPALINAIEFVKVIEKNI